MLARLLHSVKIKLGIEKDPAEQQLRNAIDENKKVMEEAQERFELLKLIRRMRQKDATLDPPRMDETIGRLLQMMADRNNDINRKVG